MKRHAKAPSAGSTTRQASRLGAILREAFAIGRAPSHAKGTGAPSYRRPKLLLGSAAALLLTLVLGVALAGAVAPTVTIENATEVAYTTAKVKGTVDSSEEPTTWRFQAATEADFSDAIDGPEGAIEEGAATVKGKFTGLAPETTYHLRLIAVNADGENSEEAASSFETKAVEAPTVTGVKATNVEFTQAKVLGQVSLADEDPGFNASCRFEYVTDDEFTAEGFENPASTSCQPETIEASSPQPVAVKAEFTGLTPTTTYHFRVVASNLGGETKFPGGAGSTFITGTVAPPTVENLQVSVITGTTAHFSAEVSPNAPGPAPQDPAFDITWHFECSPSCHGLQGGSIEGDDAAHTVENDVDQLEPNSSSPEYTVTIVAENGVGQRSEASTSFPTPASPPLVSTADASGVQAEQADLNGEVDPENSPTTYWFEWGSEDCSANPCEETPHAQAGFDEVQQLAIVATAGQFTLSFEGQSTPDLPFDASPANVQAALEALSTIGAGNVSVAGGRSGVSNRLRVSFIGSLSRTDVPSLLAAEGTTPLSVDNGANPGSVQASGLLQGGYRNGAQHVLERLSGLAPDTTYHFRVLAENSAGTSEGLDRTFTTAPPASGCPNEALRIEQHATYLPDCRAFEMVSPQDKNGGDIRAVSSRTFVASDGNAVIFPSYTGFADPKGGQFDFEYLAERTAAPGTTGWSTHAITPAQEQLTVSASVLGAATSFDAVFTPDLSSGIYRSWRPLTDGPAEFNSDIVHNLYRIDGLRGGPGVTTLLSDAFAPIPTLPLSLQLLYVGLKPMVIGASTDLSHVVFESNWPLTADAPPGFFGPKLYEYADGTLRLAGILPNGKPASASSAVMTQPAFQFGFPMPHSVSSDGSHVFFTDLSSGNVYIRIDGNETVQLNATEKTSPESPQPAALLEASADGSRAFFLTGEGLVDGDDDGSEDLYMYDEKAPAGSRLTLISPPGGNATGVIAASQDGHYLYFTGSFGQILVWHDGIITVIGAFSGVDDAAHNEPMGRFRDDARHGGFVSADGRRLLFTTTGDDRLRGHGGFAGYDQNGYEELYLYSADSGRLQCVSCNPSGAPAMAASLAFANVGAGAITWHSPHAISDDGRYVFFNTAESLLPQDTNGLRDAYEFDSRSGELHLLSSGTDPVDSFFVEASGDTRDVFIGTHQRLVGWDQDGNYDMYDVRIDGGFPEPPPVPAPCQGESCRAAAQGAAAAPQVGSGQVGAGNPKQRCPKGRRARKVHGKTRCVKPHKRHRKGDSRNRTANTDRRTSR